MKLRIFASVLILGLAVIACAIPIPTPTLAPTSNPAEEAAVRAVVEGLGSKLKLVALLSPTAAQDIQTQYAPYVAPDLLNQWANDLTQAPGKLTSSPWPERITSDGARRGRPSRRSAPPPGPPATTRGFIGSRPSRCIFLRASLRARRIASAFSRAFFSEGFS